MAGGGFEGSLLLDRAFAAAGGGFKSLRFLDRVCLVLAVVWETLVLLLVVVLLELLYF